VLLRKKLSPTVPKFSQAELAKKVGVTPQSVSAWLSGVAKPSVDKMALIQRLTGVKIESWAKPAKKAKVQA
jgi:transcriptional regulator with XRE-family HTH domain